MCQQVWPASKFLFNWSQEHEIMETYFLSFIGISIASAMVIFVHKNPERKKSYKLFCVMLVQELVQPYLDKYTDGTYPAPWRHFPVSSHLMGKCSLGYTYKKKPNDK